MSKIRNTGAGAPPPIGGPDPTENIKESAGANETTRTDTGTPSTSPKEVTGDKYAQGDLKAKGDRTKTQLDSDLKNKGVSPEQKALAEKAAKDQIRFAPPYVPVGPVVTGDNIATPGHPVAGETRQMNLKADQFQINDQGNLVITNEKLIEYFKSLKESGQEILLGITPKKPE
jgi:hypothetical protein